jgi:hypothetical protein
MNSSEIVARLRELGSIQTSALYSQRRTLNEAASHIEAQDRLIGEVTLERDRLKFVILSSYREMDWELIRAARYALEGTKSLPFKITGHEESLPQKDKS